MTLSASRIAIARSEAARIARPARRAAAVGAFVVLSLGIAAVGAVAARAGIVPPLLPFVLAIGPAVVAVALAAREGNGAVRRLLASAKTGPVERRWWAALAIPVLGTLAVVPIAVALGQPSVDLFSKIFPAIVIVPLVVLIPAFTEEIAWRGFALKQLMTTISPLRASILLAVPWVVLHLVLFLPGQMHEALPVWPSVVGVSSLAIIGSWLYVRSGGSVLLVGLFHALFNGTTPLMSGIDSNVTWELRALVFAGVAIAVLVLGGFRGTQAGEVRRSA